MRRAIPIAIILGLSLVQLGANPSEGNPSTQGLPPIDSKALLGHWYMGTGTGIDCYLEIQSESTFRIKYGHVFPGMWRVSSWSRQGDRIIVEDKYLREELGQLLKIVRYKSSVVLVPEKQLAIINLKSFIPDRCFWANKLGEGGLELSKDATDIGW